MKNLIKFLFFVLLVSAGISVLYDHRLKTDRKSTRLNSSHSQISYAVFCLKKKKIHGIHHDATALIFAVVQLLECLWFLLLAQTTTQSESSSQPLSSKPKPTVGTPVSCSAT